MIDLQRRNEDGIALITAMFVSFIALTLIAVMFTQVVHTNESTGRDRRITSAFHAAEAGIDAAIARLAGDRLYAGGTGNVTAGGTTVGSYSTSISDPGPGVTNRRAIIAQGTSQSGARTLKQVVELVPLAGFDYAMFSASTLGVSNHFTTIGSIYSASAATVNSNSIITGDVVSPSNITTSNGTTVTGDVWSGGNVVIGNGTTVTGNVLATGSAMIVGKVTGDVRAASITNTGTIQGQQIIAAQPSPATRTLPTFTFNATNYSPPPVAMTSLAFQTCWNTGVGCPIGVSRTSMSGTYYITDGGTVTGPNQKTTLTGDLTIITNGILNISRDFNGATSAPYKLVVISTSTSTSPPAVTWTNNVTNPPNIQTFIYSTGLVTFSNLKTFNGIVYAGAIQSDQQFTIAYEPSLRNVLPGFTWNLAAAGEYEIKPLTWRECAGPTNCG